MRSVAFSSIVNGVSARIGLDPTISPTASTLATVAEYVNTALRGAWETYPWPDFVRFENRQFYANWSSSTTYAANAVVLGSDRNYYYSKAGGNINHNPTTDATDTYWALASSYTATNGTGILFAIDLDQVLSGVAQTPIGEVLGVWDSDPRTNRYSTPINWFLTNDGIIVGQNGLSVTSIPSTVWVEFSARPTVYTADSYSSSTATVPYVLAEAIKELTVAAFLRSQNDYPNAAAASAVARELLEKEWDKLEMKQGQQGRFSAMTR